MKVLKEGISTKKVEDRFSRNLSFEGIDHKTQEIVTRDSRGYVMKVKAGDGNRSG